MVHSSLGLKREPPYAPDKQLVTKSSWRWEVCYVDSPLGLRFMVPVRNKLGWVPRDEVIRLAHVVGPGTAELYQKTVEGAERKGEDV
jgi:hypothetical protein